MSLEAASFAFIVTLAAVVNGLGIVRWLTALAEYLNRRETLDVSHYWVYNLAATFQFMLHILLWWSLWGLRDATRLNFVTYLVVLTGPVLLFLGSSLLAPSVSGQSADLRAHYFGVRRPYATILMLVWIWALALSPVLRGTFLANWPMFVLFLLVAAALRSSASPKVNGGIALTNWTLLIVYVAVFSLRLGGVAAAG
jgi:hypothetical protein